MALRCKTGVPPLPSRWAAFETAISVGGVRKSLWMARPVERTWPPADYSWPGSSVRLRLIATHSVPRIM